MNIIYMGTPEFAVAALQSIVDAGHLVSACFTQPDKPKGRSKKLIPTPVKEKATELQIPVYQPERLRDAKNAEIIRKYNPDVIVVAAYGQILPEEILSIPKLGCINIHASLLPKYRGAAPIEWAIINGEKETGVTTMFMAKGLDTGDMIEKTAVPIEEYDTGVSLHDKLMSAGADLIVHTLKKLEEGDITRTPQNDEESSYASMLNKEMGRLDFSKSAAELDRLIRGLQPWPVAYTFINGKTIKIYEAAVKETTNSDLSCGTVCEVTKKNFTVMCGRDALVIKRLQPEGKKPMDAASFLAGNKLKVGQIL